MLNQHPQYATPTPTWAIMSQPPRNFSWFVARKLAGFGYPTDENIPFLAAQGIKTLVNTTGTHYYEEAATTHGLTVHSIAVQDFCPPTVEQIEEFIRIVDNADGVRAIMMHS